MKCPFCGADDTRVIDSRPADDNTSIRRRRQCDVCQKRFTTYEKVEEICSTWINRCHGAWHDGMREFIGFIRAVVRTGRRERS